VRALFFIAFHHAGRPAQMREVAEHAKIPARFLEQIFNDLKRAGLVAGKRGPNGGYQLAKRANEITLGDVIRALEGAAVVLDRADESGRIAIDKDPIAAVLADLTRSVEQCFDRVTIADVCQRGEVLGVPRRGALEGPDYAI
jgi:Rrf2 family protein